MRSLLTLVLLCMLLPKADAAQLRCYTCNPPDCNKYQPMTCPSDFNYCFTASATMDSDRFTLKGCAKPEVCNSLQSLWPRIVITNVRCCEGNLCNGAESFTLSFLLIFIPLLSSILFF